MDRETDGFKFAVTLLAAFGFISFKVYSYFKDTSVDEYLYFFVVTVLSFAIMIVLFFLIYIFLKGYHFEMYNRTFHYLAHKMYETAFLLFLLSLGYVLYMCVFKTEPLAVADDVNTAQSLVSGLIVNLFIVIFIIYVMEKLVDRFLEQWYETETDQIDFKVVFFEIGITSVLLLICLTFWPVLFTTLSNSPLQPAFPTLDR